MPERHRPVLAWVLAALFALTATASAGELVMFETAACPWCVRWHREIGPIYDKTAEGRDLTLRRVDLHAVRPADLDHIKGIRFTPTFVALADGREVGRIVGYPGEDHFWAALSALHARIRDTEARAP